MLLHVVVGDEINQRSILRRLAELQYKRNDIDLKRGTYRVRGEVIDIHPADSEREAVRIEMFDAEVVGQARRFGHRNGENLLAFPRSVECDGRRDSRTSDPTLSGDDNETK